MEPDGPSLLFVRAHGQGALEVVHAAAAPGDRYLVQDETGAAYEITPVRQIAGRDIGLDLLDAEGSAVVPWRVVDGADLRLSLDPADPMDETWTAPFAGRLEHIDPVSGGATPVQPGRSYRCLLRSDAVGAGSMLAADFTTAEGEPLAVESPRTAIATGMAETVLAFTAPDGAGGVRLHVQAGGELKLARPQLIWADAGAGPLPVRRLPIQVLAQLSGSEARDVARVRLPLPARLVGADPRPLTVILVSADGEIRSSTIVFHHDPAITVAKQGLERASLVRLVGRLTRPPERYLRLQFNIDGRSFPAQTVKAAANGKFDARLPVPRELLDGRPHHLEVREADSQAILFTSDTPLAAFHSRWPTLQQWAQPPLSAESAPAAAHHLRALEVWSSRRSRGESVPPVGELLEELLAGVRPRTSWRPLSFPEVERPRVSVVVPAHNKFEVTYAGLVALLFAPNETSFEVIVVDDGSSDMTARLEEIVSGVRVVRHADAQGFVGACNDGAAAARGELLVFLNNDTEVTAGWLDELAAAFDRFEDVGLAGAKLIYPDGRLQEAGGIVWGTGDPWNAGRGGDADHPMWNYPRVVDYLSGAAIMVPRPVWDEVGGFGEEWAPAYFEDTDLAFKVRASGRRVVYVPTAEVYHFEGQTAGTDKAEGAKRFQEVNRPKFKAKWSALYNGHGPVVGDRPDLEKDRGAIGRVVVVLDGYADGESAALQAALDGLQSAGAKVSLLPLDLRWRPSVARLQAAGVECLYAPYVDDPYAYLTHAAPDLTAVIAWRQHLVEPLARLLPATRVRDADSPELEELLATRPSKAVGLRRARSRAEPRP